MKKISVLKAYRIVFKFLDAYYECNKSENEKQIFAFAGLLSDMSLLDDGNPVDPAAWDDWIDSIRVITTELNPEMLTISQVLESMIKFLEGYCQRTSSVSCLLTNLIQELKLLKIDEKACPNLQDLWSQSTMDS